MPTLRLHGALRSYTSGKSEIELHARTVAEAMAELFDQYPALKPHLLDASGNLRSFVNLFLNDVSVKERQGLETTLQDSDRLLLVPSIKGGSHPYNI